MSLSSEARKALDYLRADFEAKAALYADLKHILIETPDVDAFGEADMGVAFVFQGPGREIRRLWTEKSEVHVFIDDSFSRGREAYEAFCPLAELAVETLTAHALLVPSELPPATSEPFWFDAKKNHYAKQWMSFVHRSAKARSGAMPWLASAPCLEHFPLKKGGSCPHAGARRVQGIERDHRADHDRRCGHRKPHRAGIRGTASC